MPARSTCKNPNHPKPNGAMDKKLMSGQDIRSKFITAHIVQSGRDLQPKIREEVNFAQGRIISGMEVEANKKISIRETDRVDNCIWRGICPN